MPELEPLIYLRAESQEMSTKGGGGSTKEPWVDVDASGLRRELGNSLRQAAEVLQLMPGRQAADIGLPLNISLRPEALAKSNRPTKFLTDAGAGPRAAGQAGQLFTRARTSDLQSLARAVESASTNAELYALSTIREISVHEPLRDAFRVDTGSALQALIDDAREQQTLIRLDLFPWLNTTSRWTESLFGDHHESHGLLIKGVKGTSNCESIYVEPSTSVDTSAILSLYGIRAAGAEPTYTSWRELSPQAMAVVDAVGEDLHEYLSENVRPAIVGVLDSGIATDALEPYVQARETYDLGADRNPEHGTFVAGLVLAGKALNASESCFHDSPAVVIDGQVLPAGSIGENELLDRIQETVRKHSDVGVWNCSFASGQQMDPLVYSVFASELDKLSVECGVLFVQAAGNYTGSPLRTWPPSPVAVEDGIAVPADAVNSLVVGSLSHRAGAVTAVGSPASYSRRGPSFGGQTKPDLAFWSGDFGPKGEIPLAGIRSTVPGDQIAEGVGTSFSAPLVSAIAANVWSEIEDSAAVVPTPPLVKGLLIHGAALHSRDLVGSHKNYYGAGVPVDDLRSLFEPSYSFTTIHQVTLRSKLAWLRAPFPMPDCLFNADGKLRAEIFMTVSYAPILDQAFGEESVRTCVDASFGVVSRDGGRTTIAGKVPEEKTTGAHPWEADLIAAGKWSPVRTHYAKYPQGVSGDEWGLRLSLTEREDHPDGVEQDVYVFLTLRALDEDLPVHADGVKALHRLSLWNAQLSATTRVVVDGA